MRRTERHDTYRATNSGTEPGVRVTPLAAKPEQVSTEHLLASLRGVIKSIKKSDSVDRDAISALLMDLRVSERDRGNGSQTVSERDGNSRGFSARYAFPELKSSPEQITERVKKKKKKNSI